MYKIRYVLGIRLTGRYSDMYGRNIVHMNVARALGLSYTSGLTLRHLTESATLTLTLSTNLILPLTRAMRRISQQP